MVQILKDMVGGSVIENMVGDTSDRGNGGWFECSPECTL